MVQTLDIDSALTRGAQLNRDNANVTLKRVNLAWLDQLAAQRGVKRARLLDSILDELREQWQANQAGHAAQSPAPTKSDAMPAGVRKALDLAAARSGKSRDAVITDALVEFLGIDPQEVR